ncbi:MAG: hypothetical protein O7I42_05845 [Alphaproteobacteria bacterium]|nr:hypothetical protein [Alphaproteobacteria bacterium]
MDEHFEKVPENSLKDALVRYANAQKRDHPRWLKAPDPVGIEKAIQGV